jgi:DnaK suppressor protein
MTPAQRAKLEKSLVSLLEELTRKQPAKVEPNRASEAEVSDEDAQPLNEMLQTIASNRNREREGVAARARKALAKLREQPEDFGLCEQCEEEISPARLAALPYAELCVECQGSRDGPKGPATRRGLTDYR